MDPLELHALMRDGGSWYEIAAKFWAVLVLLAILALGIVVLMVLSSREDSVTGRLFRWLFFRFGARRADHLFLRVNLVKVVELAKSPPSDSSAGPTSGPSPPPLQAYLSGIGTHAMLIYSKYAFDVGQILEITPPGVDVLVQECRCISVNPPWFAIDAEPFFRDDRSKKNYRKFIGEISQVA